MLDKKMMKMISFLLWTGGEQKSKAMKSEDILENQE